MTNEIKTTVEDLTVALGGKAKKAAKKTAKKSAPKKVAKLAEKKIKLGAFAVQLMLKGKTNEQVLKECQKRFPKSKVSENSIAWYRSTARKDGLRIKTDRELTAK